MEGERYQYSPLSSQPGNPTGLLSIRLLHLLPSTDPEAVLQCHLTETEIPDYLPEPPTAHGHSPVLPVEFHPLSYTWGDSVFPKTLEVVQHTSGGKSASDGIISITKNLHSALQNLRRPDSTLVLWVDAICIYSYRTAMKRLGNLRFTPQFSEGFHANPQKLVRAQGAPLGLGYSYYLYPSFVSAKPAA